MPYFYFLNCEHLFQPSTYIHILGITTLALNQNEEYDLIQWIELLVVNGNQDAYSLSLKIDDWHWMCVFSVESGVMYMIGGKNIDSQGLDASPFQEQSHLQLICSAEMLM